MKGGFLPCGPPFTRILAHQVLDVFAALDSCRPREPPASHSTSVPHTTHAQTHTWALPVPFSSGTSALGVFLALKAITQLWWCSQQKVWSDASLRGRRKIPTGSMWMYFLPVFFL